MFLKNFYFLSHYKAPLICGGSQLESPSNQCWSLYNDVTNTVTGELYSDWIESTPMSQVRVNAASTKVLEAGMTLEYNWWVTGGQDKDGNPLKSTEIRWANGTWGPGPDLPQAVYGHCVIQIQRDISVIIGGQPFHDNYQYNWVTKQWDTFPQLRESRFYHACGVLRNNLEGPAYDLSIVVFGGLSNVDGETLLPSTEIFNSLSFTWELGPNYEMPIYGATIVQNDQDTIYAFGGASVYGGMARNRVLSLSKSDLSTWTYSGESVISRYSHIAISMPKSFFQCNLNQEIVAGNYFIDFNGETETESYLDENGTTEVPDLD